MGAAYTRKKRTCIFLPSVKLNAILKLLKQYGCPNISALKMIFLYLHTA